MSKETKAMKIPWRKNVLALVGAGYFTVIVIFTAMTWCGGMTAEDAYEVVKGPLMALIGGSLAISKDLIPLQDRDDDADDDRGTQNRHRTRKDN